MEVKLIEPYGFCFGVENAYNNVLHIKNTNKNKKIHVINDLIHNEYVEKALNEISVDFLKKFDFKNFSIDDIYIIGAHGLSNKELQILKDNNIIYYDTTCPKLKNIKKQLNQFNNTILVGDKNHKEILYLNDKDNILFLDINNINYELINKNIQYHVFFQSNINEKLLKNIKTNLLNYNKRIVFHDNLCKEYLLREQQIIDLNETYDYGFVIGSKNSNNANSLLKNYYNSTKIKNIAMINDLDEIKKINLDNSKKAIIVSATSASRENVLEIYNYIKSL